MRSIWVKGGSGEAEEKEGRREGRGREGRRKQKVQIGLTQQVEMGLSLEPISLSSL